MKFENTHVIVTGGTRGIGAGIAEAFLKEGAHVVATYMGNDEKANAFKNKHAQYGDKLKLAKFDVSNNAQVENFFQNFPFPSLEVLVNNSGIRRDSIIASMTENDWDLVLDTNLKGTYLMTKNATLMMMKTRYGRIINMSSIGGKLGLPGQANYAASKAGQIALSLVTAKEVRQAKHHHQQRMTPALLKQNSLPICRKSRSKNISPKCRCAVLVV